VIKVEKFFISTQQFVSVSLKQQFSSVKIHHVTQIENESTFNEWQFNPHTHMLYILKHCNCNVPQFQPMDFSV